MQLEDRYNPNDVEKRIYTWWEQNGYFQSEDTSTRPPFSIILPPPNITGSLHLGHALDHTVQDVMVRWKRMQGFNVMWLPGTDHAGIATQTMVEKDLKKEKLTRRDLGREKFVERIWKWRDQYGNRIYDQMRRLGDSCDWKRATFTLDEGVSKAVRKVFVHLYKKNWIYRGTRLINWSTALESAISDLEVEYKETKGTIYHIRYPLTSGGGEIVVATTRPETLLGDSAVAVHPDDERYKGLIGKTVNLPLTDRKIPIIADASVEKEFGSGAVKITPAHDFNDYETGKRHKLEMINILNPNGTLNAAAGTYQGLSVTQARAKVIADLETQGLLVKAEPHVHMIGHCQRSGVVAEPMLSDQWFVKTSELAVPARRVVESGTLVFEPESWTKTYLHWLSIIQDWCISRQLWWGHRIPAWNCSDCGKITVAEVDPKSCEHCGSAKIKQDEDVLDTWFSSALWPFSTLGWPADTEAQKTFYPTTLLVTGHDIIFFWVARMIMMGLEFKKDVPFRTVYIHGMIRDAHGKKMSKTAGNSIDPIDMVDKHGADALRFTLMALMAPGRDLKFSDQRLEGYRNFMNKIWNASRFALSALTDFEPPADGMKATPNKSDVSVVDRWIVGKLGLCEKLVDEALSKYRFADAAAALYSFAWHDFCDWYLEFIKPVIYGNSGPEKAATQLVLAQVLNRLIRLLHPFVPFITEEIYQKLPIRGHALITEAYPTPRLDKDWINAIGTAEAMVELDLVKEVITALRNIRGENRIKPGVKIKARLGVIDSEAQKILSQNLMAIMTLAKLEECKFGEKGALTKCALSPVRSGKFEVDVVVPLEGLIDIGEEIKRITKTLEKSEKEIASLTARLADANFLKNAPVEVVEEGKTRLETLKSENASLQESLSRLS